jgi:hypothetical protein
MNGAHRPGTYPYVARIGPATKQHYNDENDKKKVAA